MDVHGPGWITTNALKNDRAATRARMRTREQKLAKVNLISGAVCLCASAGQATLDNFGLAFWAGLLVGSVMIYKGWRA